MVSVTGDVQTIESLEADVVVVGGGPAGIAAAVAAARSGCTVVLLERHGFLGGMATAALVGPFMTCYDAPGKRQIVRGVFHELVEQLVQRGAALRPGEVEAGSKFSAFIRFGHKHVTPFDPEELKMVALDMCERAGVQVLVNSWVIEVNKTEGKVNSVTFVHPMGMGTMSGRVFVDATGDGDIAAFCGVPFVMGRAQDSMMQPASVFARVHKVFEPFVLRWAIDHRAVVHPNNERMLKCLIAIAKERGEFPLAREHVGTFRDVRDGVWRLNVTRILGVDATTSAGMTKAEIEGREQVDYVVRFLRNYAPGFEQVRLLDTGAQCGVRETRHIVGDYTLTYDDVKQGRRFADAIACFAYPIDIHQVNGETSLMEGIQGEYYQIPYRTLIPKGMDNLLVVGRCISASHEAAASLRVMPACFATGQAGGVAAALAAQQKAPVRRLDTSEIQNVLRKQGAFLGD